MKKNRIFLIVFFCLTALLSCKKEKYGSIEFHFKHSIDGNTIFFNHLIYTNAAGNLYQVNEIKYFISKVCLYDSEGGVTVITQDKGIHYVDSDIERTLRWKIDRVPQKQYQAISFIFGLDESENKSFRFVNPPESNFWWPEVLGGGYHYMQINGKFKNNEGNIQNMNIHTGIGQIYEDNHVVAFVHNHFTVTLPVHFFVSENNTLPLVLNMEVQRWFDSPNLYNFDDFGTGIMQNQRAQELLRENGWNVFEVIPRDFGTMVFNPT